MIYFGYSLYIETEMHDISILHNIFLTFDAHLSGLFNSSLGAISDIILVLDHLGTDKSFFEVRMDNTGALRSFPALWNVHARHSSGPAVKKVCRFKRNL